MSFSRSPRWAGLIGRIRPILLSKLATTAAALWVLSPHFPASACSVCFGDPNSDLVQGAKAGVIFLGIMVYCLLMLMGGVVTFWYFRARKLALLEAGEIQEATLPTALR